MVVAQRVTSEVLEQQTRNRAWPCWCPMLECEHRVLGIVCCMSAVINAELPGYRAHHTQAST
jgi:hypothetical protein